MQRRSALKNLLASTTGLALSPVFVSALNACQPRYSADYQLLVLSPKQDELLAHLVEMIIPATDTPGAKEAGVNQYIDLVLSKIKQEEETQRFLSQLDQIDKDDFLALTLEDQVARLNTLEKQSKSGENDFFKTLKGLTMHGYYTSKIGATIELKYVHVAGSYRGDIPYDEVGKNYY